MDSELSTRPQHWRSLIPLVGERVLVMHGPPLDQTEPDLSGADVDCAVVGLDPLWPLLLTGGWRLCQTSHYCVVGWYWVLERDGEVVAVDAVDDPWGIGKDAVKTTELLSRSVGGAIPPVRAAYLTIKRLRKSSAANAQWEGISTLATENPDAYREALTEIAGWRLAELIGPHGLTGTPPTPSLLRRAKALIRVRRFGSPARVTRALFLGIRRYVWRIRHPTGLSLLVTGPDGSGKSTLAARVPSLCAGIFKRHRRVHWRPGLLPRPGALLGREDSDPTRPHAREPHGKTLSLLLLGYYWLDFFLGGWFLDGMVRVRTGLLVRERGWWDVAVDPRRYRLNVPRWLVRFLGSLLRPPDLTLTLHAPPEVLLSRKTELEGDELRRQSAAWRDILPRRLRCAHLDASRPFEEVAAEAKELTMILLERRAVSRLGAGWLALPAESTRWWLPRGPRRVASEALRIHQPVTLRGRTGWEVARTLARAGAFRYLPRGEAPPDEVRRTLAPHLPRGGTFAVSRSRHAGRHLAAILDERGALHGIAKVATNPAQKISLEREAEMIKRLAGLLPVSVRAPQVLAHGPGLLILEPIEWRPRSRPWIMDEELAAALGAFFLAGSRETSDGIVGPSHGDVAPWNLLRTSQSWVLVDWESATLDGQPYFDVCHYVVQGYGLLGHPSDRQIVEGFKAGRGWVGRAMHTYAEAGGVPADTAIAALRSYLAVTTPTFVPKTRAERRGIKRRDRLLELVG